MSVEYCLSEQDYQDFLSRLVKTKMRKIYWIGAAVLLVLLTVIALLSSSPAVFAPIFLFGLLVYLVLSAALLKAIIKSRGQQLVKSFGQEYFNSPKRLTLTEDGLEYRTVYETAQYVTRAVEKVSRDDRFVTVTMRGNLNIILPVGVPGLPEFYNALLAKIGALQPLAK